MKTPKFLQTKNKSKTLQSRTYTYSILPRSPGKNIEANLGKKIQPIWERTDQVAKATAKEDVKSEQARIRNNGANCTSQSEFQQLL